MAPKMSKDEIQSIMDEISMKMGYSNKSEDEIPSMERIYTDKLGLEEIVLSLDVLPPVNEIAIVGKATINVCGITVTTGDNLCDPKSFTWGQLFQLIDSMYKTNQLANDEWHRFLEHVRISGPVNGKLVVDTDWGS